MLLVDGPDNVTIIPSSSNKEKRTFTLSCSASCYYRCQSYSWTYNGNWRGEKTQNLTFPSLSKEDSGTYLCGVNDYFGTTYSNYYTLNVIRKSLYYTRVFYMYQYLTNGILLIVLKQVFNYR